MRRVDAHEFDIRAVVLALKRLADLGGADQRKILEDNYGQKDARLLIFDVRVAGVSIPYDQVAEDFKKLWVPILYDGPFADVPRLKALATGLETVSGQGLHAREGVVVRPYVDRRAADGTMLRVKIINPAYKETGEEFS